MNAAKRCRLLFAAQGGDCHFCGCACWIPGRESLKTAAIRLEIRAGTANFKDKMRLRRATVDHLVPRSLGGTNARSNTVMACEGCNGRKGAMPASAFRRFVAANWRSRI